MNLKQIKKGIPHGGMKEIAKDLGISKVTLSRFFNGKIKVSKAKQIEILNGTAKYLKEVQELENQAFKQFENII